MILIPKFKRALVGRNGLRVKFVHVAALRFLRGKKAFLATEDDRADARKAWLRVVDARFHFVRIRREGLVDEGTRADYGHVAEEDAEELRELVDLRLAEEVAHRQDARILLHRVEAARHVRRVAEHRRKLPDFEVAVLVADARLAVEDVVLAGALKADHNRDEKRRKDEDGEARGEDVERAF